MYSGNYWDSGPEQGYILNLELLYRESQMQALNERKLSGL